MWNQILGQFIFSAALAAALHAGATGTWRLHLLTQADARWYADDLAGERQEALMRRIRPTLDLLLAENLAVRFTPELAPAAQGVVDATVMWSPSDRFSLGVGKMRDPVDGERQVSARDLWFVERAYPSVLAPSRDVGVALRLRGHHEVRFELGVFNGAADNAAGSSDTDLRKEIAGRMEWTPVAGLVLGLGAGGGDRDGGAPAGFRTQAQRRFFRWRSGTSMDGTAWRLEPQFRYTRGRWEMAGAWIRSQLDLRRDATVRTVANDGWFLAMRRPPAQTGGRWTIAGRISGLRIDPAVFPALADPTGNAQAVRSATLGLNLRLSPHAKWAVDVERSTFSAARAAPSVRTDTAILTRLQFHF